MSPHALIINAQHTRLTAGCWCKYSTTLAGRIMATEANRRCEPLSFSKQFIQAARLSSACKKYVISLRWPLNPCVSFLPFPRLVSSSPSSPTHSFKLQNHSCSLLGFYFESRHICVWEKTQSSWWIGEILHELWLYNSQESDDKCARELLFGTSAWLIMRKE